MEEERARSKAWAERNRDHLHQKNAVWRAAHPKAGVAGVLRFRKNNPEMYFDAQKASTCNSRAKKASAPGKISRKDITELWKRQPVCIRCGTGRGIDHIVSFVDGGHNVASNLQNLCRTCNELKQAKLTYEQAVLIRELYAGGTSLSSLSEKFSVTPGAVWLAATGRTWKQPPPA